MPVVWELRDEILALSTSSLSQNDFCFGVKQISLANFQILKNSTK